MAPLGLVNITCIASLPWISLLAISVSIELVSSSARVTSVKSAKPLSLTHWHPDPKIGPQVNLGPIKTDKEKGCFGVYTETIGRGFQGTGNLNGRWSFARFENAALFKKITFWIDANIFSFFDANIWLNNCCWLDLPSVRWLEFPWVLSQTGRLYQKLLQSGDDNDFPNF